MFSVQSFPSLKSLSKTQGMRKSVSTGALDAMSSAALASVELGAALRAPVTTVVGCVAARADANLEFPGELIAPDDESAKDLAACLSTPPEPPSSPQRAPVERRSYAEDPRLAERFQELRLRRKRWRASASNS